MKRKTGLASLLTVGLMTVAFTGAVNYGHYNAIKEAERLESIANAPYKVNGRSFMDIADQYYLAQAKEQRAEAQGLENTYGFLIIK